MFRLRKHDHAKFKPTETILGVTWYWCNQCERFLQKSEFNKRPEVPCGIQAWCKACVSLHERARRKKRRSAVDTSGGRLVACPRFQETKA